MATAPATVTEFKAKFDRAFVFGAGLETVRDSDISSAMDDALLLYNSGLWSTADGKIAFMFMAAHFLVTTLQAAGGLCSEVSGEGATNRGTGVISNKSVGAVSLGYVDPPERVKRNANLMIFWETEFGKRYIAMLTPKLVGNVGVVSGPSDVGGYVTDQAVPTVPGT